MLLIPVALRRRSASLPTFVGVTVHLCARPCSVARVDAKANRTMKVVADSSASWLGELEGCHVTFANRKAGVVYAGVRQFGEAAAACHAPLLR
jgi:hypothetical protein